MKPGAPWKKAMRSAIEPCAAAAGMLGVLLLLGRQWTDGGIAAPGRDDLPMHLLTASWIILSCGTVIHHCRRRWERKSEDWFRMLVEEARDVVTRITPDGIVEYCSPAVTAFGGYASEEVIGKSIGTYFADAQHSLQARAVIAEVIQTREARTLEFLYQPKTGAPFWAEVTGKPIVAAGEVTAINCILRDASERKRVEQLLRESEEEHRLLFQNSLSAVAVHRTIVDATGAPMDYVFMQR